MLISTDLKRCVSRDLKKPFQWYALGIWVFLSELTAFRPLFFNIFCVLNINRLLTSLYVYCGSNCCFQGFREVLVISYMFLVVVTSCSHHFGLNNSFFSNRWFGCGHYFLQSVLFLQCSWLKNSYLCYEVQVTLDEYRRGSGILKHLGKKVDLQKSIEFSGHKTKHLHHLELILLCILRIQCVESF